MQKNKSKLNLLTVLVITFFSLAGFYGVLSLVVPGMTSVLKVSAESGSGSGGDGGDDSNDDNDEDEDEDKNDDNGGDDENDDNDDQDKIEKEAEKRAKDAAEAKAKLAREQLKKEAEAMRKSSLRAVSVADESDQKEVEKLNEERTKIFEKINEEIIKAEERIMRAQAEGTDVTKPLATLALAKAKAATLEQTLGTIDLSAAKNLAKEIKKLAHFARNQDLHDAKKIAQDISKVAKRITQTEGKIALFVSLGGDATQFTEALNAAKTEYTAAKDMITLGGANVEQGLVALEVVERKVKRIKNSVELAIFALGGTDQRLDDDFENEVEDVLEHLNDVAEIEGDEVGDDIARLAKEQKESVNGIANAAKNIDERNPVVQFLLGTRGKDLSVLNTEIAAADARIAALTDASSKIQDAEVKSIIDAQIASLKTETDKLKAFVSGQTDRLSVFGWLFNLF